MEEKEHRNTLPKGFWLNEYQIESVLGKPGGFGITYLATDTHLRQKVAIKEYLPTDFAIREGVSTVYVRSSADDESFQWGKKCFLDEARVLARFNHVNIVRVLRYFEANGTAYMVMEYQEGESLTEYLKKGKLEEPELLAIIEPLLSGLEEIHKAGLLHRDIKPNNIYIRNDGRPVLLDFGSARYAIGQKTRSVTSIVTPGYAPLEQYDNEIKDQGPWSDIYALGAVMYHAISGEAPPAATRRVLKDPMIPTVEIGRGKYNEPLLKAIDWALQVSEEERPKSVEEWRKAFLPDSTTALVMLPTPPASFLDKLSNSPQLRGLCMGVGGAILLLLLLVLVAISLSHKKEIEEAITQERAKHIKLEQKLEEVTETLKKEVKIRKRKEDLIKDVSLFENLKDDENIEQKVSDGGNKYYDTVGVSSDDVLHIRLFPGHLSPKVAKIPPNGKCVLYLERLRIVGDNAWVWIQYKDSRGWVNAQYLIENKEGCDKSSPPDK